MPLLFSIVKANAEIEYTTLNKQWLFAEKPLSACISSSRIIVIFGVAGIKHNCIMHAFYFIIMHTGQEHKYMNVTTVSKILL